MIVLLTGPFGVGKTSAARALVEADTRVFLFDPEVIGSFLRQLLGPYAAGSDYQDLSLWRELTVSLAARTHAETGRDLIVPISIRRRDYFDEIQQGLASQGIAVLPIRLTASRSVLQDRILGRPNDDGPHEWCLRHIDAGLEAAADSAFGIAIETDHRSPSEIAAIIEAAMEAASNSKP